MGLTKKIVIDAFNNAIAEENDMFNTNLSLDEFLKSKYPELPFIDIIVDQYNNKGHYSNIDYDDPIRRFDTDVNCSGIHEIGSCFVNFTNTDGYDRKFWEKFNRDWQNYIKL